MPLTQPQTQLTPTPHRLRDGRHTRCTHARPEVRGAVRAGVERRERVQQGEHAGLLDVRGRVRVVSRRGV